MHRFALLIERRARHVQFSRAIDRSYFGFKKRLICRELLAIFDTSVVKMKMTFALLHFILVVCYKTAAAEYLCRFLPFFSLSLFLLYTRVVYPHITKTRDDASFACNTERMRMRARLRAAI